MEEVSKYPNDLEDAIEILKIFYKNSLPVILRIDDEQKFINQSHHMAGTFIRNEWHLWWFENHTYDTWPKERPKFISWFNEFGITHADDMSAIILRSLYRNLKGLEINLEEQILVYKKYWAEQGYKDGIFKLK